MAFSGHEGHEGHEGHDHAHHAAVLLDRCKGLEMDAVAVTEEGQPYFFKGESWAETTLVLLEPTVTHLGIGHKQNM